MPTSAPGSSGRRRGARGCAVPRGFTLIELLIVIAIVAVAAGLVTWALPDRDAAKLEEEGARLSALLDMARAEARVSGATVRWVPRSDAPTTGEPESAAVQFRFVGLPPSMALPTRWLDARTHAEIIGNTTVLLGPEAILPPQRIVLRLGAREVQLASDGLGPFAPVVAAADGDTAAARP